MVILIISYIISTFFFSQLINYLSNEFAKDSIDIYVIKGNYKRTKAFMPLLKYAFSNYNKILIGLGAMGLMSIVFALAGSLLSFLIVLILELFGSSSGIEFKNEPHYLLLYISTTYFFISLCIFIFCYVRKYNEVKNEILDTL